MALGLRGWEWCFLRLEGRQARGGGRGWTLTPAYQKCPVFSIPKGLTKRITPLPSCRELWPSKGCHRYLLPDLITLPLPSPIPAGRCLLRKQGLRRAVDAPGHTATQRQQAGLGVPQSHSHVSGLLPALCPL